MMALGLYAATVPAWLQQLGAVSHLIDKAEAWCTETGTAPADVIEARLIADMLPFGYQVKSCIGHSVDALAGVRSGVFTPDRSGWPDDFAGLKAKIAGAIEPLQAVDAAEVDGFVGRDMAFVMGDMRMDFTAQDFLLSFSMPNFYFHAATAYGLLRTRGVTLGKRDYLGRPRLKN